jgi:hypothetical protein
LSAPQKPGTEEAKLEMPTSGSAGVPGAARADEPRRGQMRRGAGGFGAARADEARRGQMRRGAGTEVGGADRFVLDGLDLGAVG